VVIFEASHERAITDPSQSFMRKMIEQRFPNAIRNKAWFF